MPKRAYPPPSAEELLTHLRARSAAIFAIRAQARTEYFDSRDRVKLSISIIAARPSRLRIVGESSLTGPLITLATDGHSFQILDAQKNRFLEGRVSPCTIARIIGVELEPSEVVNVIMGGVSLIPQPTASALAWDTDKGGRERLTLSGDSGRTEILWLTRTERGFDLREAEMRDATGRPMWRVRHDEFSRITVKDPAADLSGPIGIRLPGQSLIEDLLHGSSVRLRWKDQELNPILPPEVFHLDPVPGVETAEATCER